MEQEIKKYNQKYAIMDTSNGDILKDKLTMRQVAYEMCMTLPGISIAINRNHGFVCCGDYQIIKQSEAEKLKVKSRKRK